MPSFFTLFPQRSVHILHFSCFLAPSFPLSIFSLPLTDLSRTRVQKLDIGDYHCEITSDGGQIVTTEQVEVALAHPDTTSVDYARKSSIQIDQIEGKCVRTHITLWNAATTVLLEACLYT